MKAAIAVLAGDGIGPEVTAEAVRALRGIEQQFGHSFELTDAEFGGAAIDARGEPLPATTRELCLAADAVLLGAVGGPKWSGPDARVRPEAGLLELRRVLGVYANLRPVSVHPRLVDASPLKAEHVQGVDLLIVRELTGGIYFGDKRRSVDRAVDVCEYSVGEIERIARVAGRLARTRRRLVTSVDKANVLETSRLWREVTARVFGSEFPDVRLEHMLVDSAAMHLVKRAGDFDVLLTENMFGDILSDEAAMLVGSLGLLPSASLGEGRRGLYEPIHGSAPDIAGRGVANPYGAILSAAMLLRSSLGLEREGHALEIAVGRALESGARTADIAFKGLAARSTREAGDAVLRELSRLTPAA